MQVGFSWRMTTSCCHSKKKKPFLFKEACSIMEEGRSQKRDAVKIRQKEDMLKWLGIRPIILG